MTLSAAEHQSVVDIADLAVNRYFDHYLSDVFPEQLGRMFSSHNQDAEAHAPRFKIHEGGCETRRRLDRFVWMVAGGSAVGGFVGSQIVANWSALVKLLF